MLAYIMQVLLPTQKSFTLSGGRFSQIHNYFKIKRLQNQFLDNLMLLTFDWNALTMFCDTAVSKLIDKHIEQYYVRCAIHSINL